MRFFQMIHRWIVKTAGCPSFRALVSMYDKEYR